MATKYIFVTGGVVSGLGKGITAASLGRLLKTRGLKVASQKLDPYINVDPGTMSPLQHGEVFVTDDGTETDLDLGHYERFIDENLNKYSNLTTGKVYWNVLNKERQGAYLGQTVQIIPHITNEIKSYIYNLAKSTEADVVITEIGGTTGDIESQPFLEAIRQVGLEQGPENCCYIHVVLVPYISGSDEYKSKPAQHSCKELQGMGIAPNIIVLRADGPVGNDIKRKISMFCNVRPDCVIENLTMPSLYECPLMLESAGLTNVVARQLHLQTPPSDLTEWKALISRIATRSKTCKIALVGKYVKLHDAYLSVMESLYHAGFENESKVEIKWVDSEHLVDQDCCADELGDVDGIIVPGGFGDRGIEGMIQAAQYARENHVPYFGICLGMQIMADLAQPYVQGLTLLGGEPFLNTGILLPLVKRVRKELPDKDIWSWTGYTWEEMMLETPDKLELLSLIDILVDGRYDNSKRNLMLQFRGSSNQRIIDVQKSLKEEKVVIWDKLNDGKESFEQVKRDDLL